MSYEYAGTLYDTRLEADLAAIDDWLTACGTDSNEEVLDALREHLDGVVDEIWGLIDSGEWSFPGYEDDDVIRGTVQDSIQLWVERNTDADFRELMGDHQ